MACVEAAIPVPDSRKKVDELFLYWLSEPSTQDMLRKELANIREVPCSELDDLVFKQDGGVALNSVSPYSLSSVLRSGSPHTRTPSPPPSSLVAKSPSSPRARRALRKSPHGAGGGSNLKEKLQLTTAVKNKLVSSQLVALQPGADEVDGGFVSEKQNVPSVSVTLTADGHREQGHLETKVHASGDAAPPLSPARSRSPKPASLPTGSSAKPTQVLQVCALFCQVLCLCEILSQYSDSYIL